MPASSEILHEDTAFVYRVSRPTIAPGRTLILLHGSAVDETTMMPFGEAIDPQATSIAVRGRLIQDGDRRWFTRITPTRFHQRSVRAEATAFADFLPELSAAESFSPSEAILIGYSNGANTLSSLMLLRPGLIRSVVLLRAMPVLAHPPETNLDGSRVLIISGANDWRYGKYMPALARLLRDHGAAVETHSVPAGHEFGQFDVTLIRNWLG